MLLKAERNLDCMNPHLIQSTPRVASVTVALKPIECMCNNLERGFVDHLTDPEK